MTVTLATLINLEDPFLPLDVANYIALLNHHQDYASKHYFIELELIYRQVGYATWFELEQYIRQLENQLKEQWERDTSKMSKVEYFSTRIGFDGFGLVNTILPRVSYAKSTHERLSTELKRCKLYSGYYLLEHRSHFITTFNKLHPNFKVNHDDQLDAKLFLPPWDRQAFYDKILWGSISTAPTKAELAHLKRKGISLPQLQYSDVKAPLPLPRPTAFSILPQGSSSSSSSDQTRPSLSRAITPTQLMIPSSTCREMTTKTGQRHHSHHLRHRNIVGGSHQVD